MNSLIWNIVIHRFRTLLFQSFKVVESPGTIVTTTARETAFICFLFAVICLFLILKKNTEVILNSPSPTSTPNNYSFSLGSLYIFRFLTCPEILSIRWKDVPNAWKVQTVKSKMLYNWRFYILVKLIYLKQTDKILEVLFCLIVQSHSLECHI